VPAATADDATPAAATGRPAPLPDNGETAQAHYFGDSGRQEIALTFDLGSDRGYTEQILDFLDEKGIKATFGITGRWAEDNPDLVQRIVDDGHMLINHTYSHSSFTGDSTGLPPLTSEERVEEIQDTDQIVFDLTGYQMKPYFRLPYGDGATDPKVMDDIYAAGYYLVIMWTCDSYGWQQWTAAEIIQHCGQEQPGGIILMHVGSDGTDQDALPGLVEQYEQMGYAFVTVEELLQP
jgi:peptidoglycan/xylan/chitin deacetylase (PgdA/CDA1 family)